jgi:uncharacterized protein (TIGR02646 family)
MIRVVKSPTPPAVLNGSGVAAAAAHHADYTAKPTGYQSGAVKFTFDGGIYGHASVKTALMAAQYDKCAFCECKIAHVQHGDVEHFRPKAAFRQKPGDALTRPGYYWLAYDWDNLLLSCQLCNQRYKENLFPLRVQKHRTRSPTDPHAREKSLLIHPALEDPGRHIEFSKYNAVPRNRSVRGTATIAALGLNRPKMVDVRLARYEDFVLLRTLRERLRAIPAAVCTPLDVNDLADVERRVQEHTSPHEEFSAMARAVFA